MSLIGKLGAVLLGKATNVDTTAAVIEASNQDDGKLSGEEITLIAAGGLGLVGFIFLIAALRGGTKSG